MTRRSHDTGELLRIALVLPLVAFLAAGPAAVHANPKLQEVVSGEVVMQDHGNQVDVTNGRLVVKVTKLVKSLVFSSSKVTVLEGS